MEAKGRKRKIGEREGERVGEKQRREMGAQTNTVSLGHSPGLTAEHRVNKH